MQCVLSKTSKVSPSATTGAEFELRIGSCKSCHRQYRTEPLQSRWSCTTAGLVRNFGCQEIGWTRASRLSPTNLAEGRYDLPAGSGIAAAAIYSATTLTVHLKTKFILVSLVGGLSSVAIIGAVSYIKAKKSIEQAVGVSFHAAAHNTAKQADHVLHQAQIAVEQLSRMRAMEGVLADRDGAPQTYLMNFVRVAAINRDGEIIASSDLDEPGNRFADHALVEQVLTGQPHFDDVHFDEPSQTWVVTISYPIPTQ
jgi:hypothetical protein